MTRDFQNRWLTLVRELRYPSQLHTLDTGSNRLVFGLASTVVGIVLAAIILFAVPPIPESSLRWFDYATSLRMALAVLGLLVLAALFFPRMNRLWTACLPGAFFVWLALRLYFVWRTAPNVPDMLAGLLPWQDAGRYYVGGMALLHDATIDIFTMRRPLQAVLLAIKLGIANGNLQVAIALGAATVGLAILAMAREVQRSLGLPAAVTFAIAAAAFIMHDLATTSSEPHGLLLSTIAFGCLWRAAISRSLGLYGVGMLLLTTALYVRQGPMLILPAFTLWGFWALDANGRWSFRGFALGVAACAVGVLLPSIYNALFGDPSGGPPSNYAFILYNIATGSSFYGDYPQYLDLHAFTEAQRTDFARGLAFQALLHHPSIALSYYFGEVRHAYLFVTTLIPTLPLRVVAQIGIVWCLLSIRDRLSCLLMVGLLAAILSHPFIIIEGERVFATVVPLVAIFCAFGTAALIRLVRLVLSGDVHPTRISTPPSNDRGMAALYAGVFVGIAVAPMMIFGVIKRPIAVDNPACPNNETAIRFIPNVTGTGVQVRADISATREPNVSWRDFARDPEFKSINQLQALFSKTRPPFNLFILANYAGGHPDLWYAIAESPVPLDRPAIFCGDRLSEEETNWHSFFSNNFMRVTDVIALPD